MSVAPKRRSLVGILLPRSLAQLAVWLLMVSVGVAGSGIGFFFWYQYKLAKMDQRIQAFSKLQQQDFEKRSKEFGELVKSSKAEIEKASKGSGSQTSEVTRLLEKVGPSIAYVQGVDAANQPAGGSGFVVTSNDKESWVMTNFHLIAGAAASKSPVKVRLGNAVRDGTIWTWDEGRDLALLILKVGGLPVLEWSNGETSIGVQVWAIGSAPGKLQSEAAQGHLLDTSADGLLTDAHVPTGASGGPLLNNDGKVIGVLSVNYAPDGYPASSGWAVPIRLSCQKVLRCPS